MRAELCVSRGRPGRGARPSNRASVLLAGSRDTGRGGGGDWWHGHHLDVQDRERETRGGGSKRKDGVRTLANRCKGGSPGTNVNAERRQGGEKHEAPSPRTSRMTYSPALNFTLENLGVNSMSCSFPMLMRRGTLERDCTAHGCKHRRVNRNSRMHRRTYFVQTKGCGRGEAGVSKERGRGRGEANESRSPSRLKLGCRPSLQDFPVAAAEGPQQDGVEEGGGEEPMLLFHTGMGQHPEDVQLLEGVGEGVAALVVQCVAGQATACSGLQALVFRHPPKRLAMLQKGVGMRQFSAAVASAKAIWGEGSGEEKGGGDRRSMMGRQSQASKRRRRDRKG